MQPQILRTRRALTFTAALSALVASAACSASNKGEPGGSMPAGGTSSSSGGSAGGSAPGAAGSAGVPVSVGGQATVAGGSNGGAYAGGAPSSGGASPAGGASAAAGASSAAGAGNPSAAAPSAGCGKATTLVSGRASIDVGGKMREYILALPDKYDPAHPYRLIFGWHPWGGSAQQVASGGYYGLVNQAKGSAIFVAGEGLEFGDNGKGWGNSNGEDIALLAAMLERFRSQLCVDENRIFSTGFSFGGMFSFAAGCSATSMMRAVAPMAGNTSVAGCGNGTRPVALMGFHGVDDNVVAIDGGRKGRDAFVQRNKCTTQTMPAQTTWCDTAGANYQPCSCVSYQGCMEGYPVTWCEFKGTHMPAPNSAATLWSFFSQF